MSFPVFRVALCGGSIFTGCTFNNNVTSQNFQNQSKQSITAKELHFYSRNGCYTVVVLTGL